MKNLIKNIEQRILSGGEITYDESLKLINLGEEGIIKSLLISADNIRKANVGNDSNLCTIINAKSGKCSEDCKYCAQSVHYNTNVDQYNLLEYDKILERALYVEKKGVHRFSLVTSGRGIEENDLVKLTQIYKKLKRDTTLMLCASHGILTYDQALKLKEAGVDMYHHNLETSKDNYSNICTSHSFEDRVNTIKDAMKAGLKVCSGGIIGMKESLKDRVDMAFELKKLKIESVPINILNPIKGTPYESLNPIKPLEALKTMAVVRFILPKANIRYAGGRLALGDNQRLGLRGGVDSMLTGDYLTTTGQNIESDKKMLGELGYTLE
ncbi:biotin synthase BioB [Clostridiaceae bacterium M8S5]|nr:biotin synthase BioB [Clostridiaceae bacterium M8S5]